MDSRKTKTDIVMILIMNKRKPQQTVKIARNNEMSYISYRYDTFAALARVAAL